MDEESGMGGRRMRRLEQEGEGRGMRDLCCYYVYESLGREGGTARRDRGVQQGMTRHGMITPDGGVLAPIETDGMLYRDMDPGGRKVVYRGTYLVGAVMMRNWGRGRGW